MKSKNKADEISTTSILRVFVSKEDKFYAKDIEIDLPEGAFIPNQIITNRIITPMDGWVVSFLHYNLKDDTVEVSYTPHYNTILN